MYSNDIQLPQYYLASLHNEPNTSFFSLSNTQLAVFANAGRIGDQTSLSNLPQPLPPFLPPPP